MRKFPFLWAALLVVALILFFSNRQAKRSPELDAPAVLTQVRKLQQLATVSYTIQKVIGLREQTHPVGSESILLVVQANVQAGIDLGQLRSADVQVQRDGAVNVRLPEAKILTVSIDEKQTKVWDRQKTWWTVWIPYSPNLEQRARQAGLEAVKETAVQSGILTQAEQSAAASIEALLRLAGVTTVTVVPRSAS